MVITYSKHGVLQLINTYYDPLGFGSVAIFRERFLYQELWSHTTLCWEAILPMEIRKRWYKWLRTLHHLDNTSIPHWFTGLTLESDIELHMFSDASRDAYRAVIYHIAHPGNTSREESSSALPQHWVEYSAEGTNCSRYCRRPCDKGLLWTWKTCQSNTHVDWFYHGAHMDRKHPFKA